MSSQAPVPIEQLLAHREWVRRVARAMVRDENDADDLEQGLWLDALQHPPRTARSPRGWLFTALRRDRTNARRSEASRTAREHATARAEAAPSADEMVARADALKRVVVAVMDLSEPYRSAILYRYFEDLPPAAIAERLGVPVETVRTRLKRALAQLRERFDAEHEGDRETWRIAMLPLLRRSLDTSAPRAPVTASTTASILGGVLMAKKVVVACVILVLLLIGGWFATARFASTTNPTTQLAPATSPVAGKRHDRAQDEGKADAAEAAAKSVTEASLGAVVVDVRTGAGEALSGVRVEAYRAGDFGVMSDSWVVAPFYRDARTPAASAVTDAEGRARLPRLSAGKCVVVAVKAGRAKAGRRVEVHSGGAPDPLELRLDAGLALAGRVLDRDGAPVAGARLLATEIEQLLAVDGAVLQPSAVSDAQGRFLLDGLSTGERAIWVAKAAGLPGCAGRVRVPFAGEYEIRLDGNRVAGRITEEPGGAPVGDARVRAYCTTISGDRIGTWIAESTSAADGRYELDTVFRAGVLKIVAEKPGYVVAHSPTDEQSTYMRFDATGRASCDIVLRRGARLVGVVKGPDGPVVGAQVSVCWKGATLVTQARTTTDDSGRYESAVPEGPVVVFARSAGLFQEGVATDWMQRLINGESPDGAVQAPASGEVRFDIDLRRGAVVEGTVTTSEGVAVAAAVVKASWLSEDSTDATGRFRVTGVVPGGAVSLEVTKDGFVTATEPVTLKDVATPIDVRIQLRPAPHVIGRVTTPDGAPAEGAYVQVVTRADLDKYRYSDLWTYAPRRTVSADGSYDVPLAVDEAAVVVRAGGPGWQTVTTRDVNLVRGEKSCVVDVVLTRGGTIEGRVVAASDGQAIAGALVRVAKEPESSLPTRTEIPAVAAVSDTKGQFRVDGAPPGTTIVSVEAEGFITASSRVSVPSTAPIVVNLSPGLEVSGRIELADGSPVEGVGVVLSRSNAPAGADNWHGAPETGADGIFRLRGLAPGTYVLSATGGFSRGNIRRKTVEGVVAGTNDLHVVVQSGGVIAGRLRGADGRPVRGARIIAHPPTGTTGGQGETGVDGSFRVLGLDDGPYSVTAQPPQPEYNGAIAWGVAYLGIRRDGVNVGTEDLDLVLPFGEKIDGVLLGADGAPLADAWIAARVADERRVDPWTRASSLPLGAKTDSAGRFSITGLESGRYRLVQMLGADVGRAKPLALDGGEEVAAGTSGLRLVAGTLPKITGVVSDESGVAVGGASVVATQVDGAGRLTTTTTADGAFAVDGAARGATYALVVRKVGFAPTRIGSAAAGSAGMQIRLSRGVSAGGRVVDASGNPLANVQLQLTDEVVGDPYSAKTDADGRFTVEHLGAGTYRVEALFPTPGKPCVVRQCGSLRGGDSNAQLRMSE
ncbi:MAG: sigma-70 family RNA polymerase sigma factor [Planctomycetes bacterium]|nr:sigma-70 family RNA polymerase sigma factor [Planctomycetota bacterium]